MILQPTSPFRQPVHIRESIALLERTGADSVVSVSEVPAHYNPMRTLRVDDRGMASLFVTGSPCAAASTAARTCRRPGR